MSIKLDHRSGRHGSRVGVSLVLLSRRSTLLLYEPLHRQAMSARALHGQEQAVAQRRTAIKNVPLRPRERRTLSVMDRGEVSKANRWLSKTVTFRAKLRSPGVGTRCKQLELSKTLTCIALVPVEPRPIGQVHLCHPNVDAVGSILVRPCWPSGISKYFTRTEARFSAASTVSKRTLFMNRPLCRAARRRICYQNSSP